MGARWYSPSLARFISEDPIAGEAEEPPSLNPYLYCADDPINAFDPTGKYPDPNGGYRNKSEFTEPTLSWSTSMTPEGMTTGEYWDSMADPIKEDRAAARARAEERENLERIVEQYLVQLRADYDAAIEAGIIGTTVPGLSDIGANEDLAPFILDELNCLDWENLDRIKQSIMELNYYFTQEFLSEESVIRILREQGRIDELLVGDIVSIIWFLVDHDVREDFTALVTEAYVLADPAMQSLLLENYSTREGIYDTSLGDIGEILSAPFRPGTNIVDLFREGKVEFVLSICWGSGGYSINLSNRGITGDYLVGGGIPGFGGGVIVDEHPEREGVVTIGGSGGYFVEGGVYSEIDEHGNAVDTIYYFGYTPAPSFSAGASVEINDMTWEELLHITRTEP